MGKYQNVSTPRFYVDYFQYALTTGLITVNDISNNFGADNNELKKLFYLNPAKSNTFSIASGEYYFDINTKYLSDLDYNLNYCMFLNHNLLSNPLLVNISGLDKTSIVNYEELLYMVYNGWSYVDLAINNNLEFNIGRFVFTNTSSPVNLSLGAISMGTKYDMPHSPDLDLTMTREFGGAKKQFTRGGALLTNYNYTQPPTWGDGEAWGLYTDAPANLGARRAGRRVWDLKFSYLSASDIMADMEMLNLHPIDEDVDHDYQPSLTDTNFFSQFMQKTLGGSLKFIFQPNNTDFNPDGFAICVLDQDSISIKQVAHNTYNISLRIMEVW